MLFTIGAQLLNQMKTSQLIDKTNNPLPISINTPTMSTATNAMDTEELQLTTTFEAVFAPLRNTPYILISCLPASNAEILGHIVRNVVLRSCIEFDVPGITRFLASPSLNSMQVLGTVIRDSIGAERASNTHFAMPFLQRQSELPWFFAACTIEGTLDIFQSEFAAAQTAKASRALRVKDMAAVQSASSEPAKATPRSGTARTPKGTTKPAKNDKQTQNPSTDRGVWNKPTSSLMNSRSKFTQLLQPEPIDLKPSIIIPLRIEVYNQLEEGHTQIPIGWLLGFSSAKDSRADTLLRGLRGIQYAINSTAANDLLWCYQHLGIPTDSPVEAIHQMLTQMVVVEWVHALAMPNSSVQYDNLRVSVQGPRAFLMVIDLFTCMIMQKLAPESPAIHKGTLEGATVSLMGLQMFFQRVNPRGKQSLSQVLTSKSIMEINGLYKPACRLKFHERRQGLSGELSITSLINTLCRIDTTLSNNILILGCMDVRITSNQSANDILQGYFIEFTSPTYKIVAVGIFNSPAFHHFANMYQLTGTLNERSRIGLTSVIPTSPASIDEYPSLNAHQDYNASESPDASDITHTITLSEYSLIVPTQCVQPWSGHEFNGWCLLAVGCLIRGLSPTLDNYSPLQLYNGIVAITSYYNFLIVPPGEELDMLKIKELLHSLKRVMEISYRRHGSHCWPSLPVGQQGEISLTTFMSLVQDRVPGFLGSAKSIAHNALGSFSYQYFSLKTGTQLTIQNILHPTCHMVGGVLELPILCQVNRHFKFLIPRDLLRNVAVCRATNAYAGHTIEPPVWPDMRFKFGMITESHICPPPLNDGIRVLERDNPTCAEQLVRINRELPELNGPPTHTDNRSTRFRGKKLQETPLYPHPEFHYDSVPAVMADLTDLCCIPDIVAEIKRILNVTTSPYQYQPQGMVEDNEGPNPAANLSSLPLLAHFLILAKQQLISLKLIHPAAKWNIMLLPPHASKGEPEIQLPHTDEVWEIFASAKDREQCKRYFSRNDSIIIALGNNEVRDTLIDFAKNLTSTLHNTSFSEHSNIKLQNTVRFHLHPGQAAIFSSAAVHLEPPGLRNHSYQVFIRSISPNWPSAYIPTDIPKSRAFGTTFDPFFDPPDEHWFLSNSGAVNRIPHSVWIEPWVQFLSRDEYDDTFRSEHHVSITRQRLENALRDTTSRKNPEWEDIPITTVTHHHHRMFPHHGIHINTNGILITEFGVLTTDNEQQEDMDEYQSHSDEASKTTRTTRKTFYRGDGTTPLVGRPEPPTIETSHDVILELLTTPQSISDSFNSPLIPPQLTQAGSKKRKARAKSRRSARMVMSCFTNYELYSSEQQDLIEDARVEPRLRIVNSNVGKVLVVGPGHSYKPGELIWFLPDGHPESSALIAIPDPRDPDKYLCLRTKNYKYEYGLMNRREIKRQVFRPNHRDPASFLCATGNSSRANCYIDISSQPFRIVANKWIPSNTPVVYHDNQLPIEYMGISRYSFSGGALDIAILTQTSAFMRPDAPIRFTFHSEGWVEHIRTVISDPKLDTIETLAGMLTQFPGTLAELRVLIDANTILTSPDMDGLNLLRTFYAKITAQEPPAHVNGNMDYNLPLGRTQLLKALRFFGQKYYFRDQHPSSDPVEILLHKCSTLCRHLAAHPEERILNPFSHTELMLLLSTTSRKQEYEIFETVQEADHIFHHTHSSVLRESQPALTWKSLALWYGDKHTIDRVLMLYSPSQHCYWIDTIYWRQLRLTAMDWFYNLLIGALSMQQSHLNKLRQRFPSILDIITELKLSKGFPSNVEGDGPEYNPQQFNDSESGGTLTFNYSATLQLLSTFLQTHDYIPCEYTIIEWILCEDNPFQFHFTSSSELDDLHYFANPADGYCGIWVILRSFYLFRTNAEPPFPLTKEAAGEALNMLIYNIISKINTEVRSESNGRLQHLKTKMVFIWTSLLKHNRNNELWNAALIDPISLDFSEINQLNHPEYMEIEEVNLALQLLNIRFVIWVPALDGPSTQMVQHLAIGSFHPFGLHLHDALADVIEVPSLRWLFQSLLNQDNIHIAFNCNHYYIRPSTTLLHGLSRICLRIVKTLLSSFCIRNETLVPSGLPVQQPFTDMYLQHLLLGGHPHITPAASIEIPHERGLLRNPGPAIKANFPLARYSPRRLTTTEAQLLMNSSSIEDSTYAVTHPDDAFYVSDGKPHIQHGFLGSLANDLLGPVSRSYHSTVRFTVHPREGLQTWLVANKFLPRTCSLSEISFEYGQPYWMERLQGASAELRAKILHKYNCSQYISPIVDRILTPTSIINDDFIHFLDSPKHYTSYGDAHWNQLATFNKLHHTYAEEETIPYHTTKTSYDQPIHPHQACILTTSATSPDHNRFQKSSHASTMGRTVHRPSTDLTTDSPREPRLPSGARPPIFLNPEAALLRPFPPHSQCIWLFDPKYIEWSASRTSTLSTLERSLLHKRLGGTLLPPLGVLPNHSTEQKHLDAEILAWYAAEVVHPKLQLISAGQHGSRQSLMLTVSANSVIPKNHTILIPCGLVTNQNRGSHIHQTDDGFITTKKCTYDVGLMTTSSTHLALNPINHVRYYNPKYPEHAANACWDCTVYGFPKLIATKNCENEQPIILTPEGGFKPPKNMLFKPLPGNIRKATPRKADRSSHPLTTDLQEFSHCTKATEAICSKLHEPDILYRFQRSSTYAGFGTLNINGKFNDSLLFQTIFHLMNKEHLFGFAILDTRLPYPQLKVHRQIIARIFGDGTIIIPYPGREPINAAGLSERDQLVGGITLIFIPRADFRIISKAIDPYRLGIWIKVVVLIGTTRVTWVPCYLPHPSSMSNTSDCSGALYAKLSNCLKLEAVAELDIQSESPMDWILRKLASLFAGVYGTPDDRGLLQGDFNLTYKPSERTKYSLVNSFQDMGLNCNHRLLLEEFSISPLTFMQTFKDVSDIDHCLSTVPKSDIVMGGIGHHPSWNIIGMDHKPIWIGLSISSQLHNKINMTLRKLPMVNLGSTAAHKQEYKAGAQKWFDSCVGPGDTCSQQYSFRGDISPLQAEIQLEYLTYSIAQHFSNQYAKKTNTPRRAKRHDSSFVESAETAALNLMLAFYVAAYRIIKDDVTNPLDIRTQEDDLHAIAFSYATEINSLLNPDSAGMAIPPDYDTGHSLLEFWTNASRSEALLTLAEDYDIVRRLAHGKYRKYKRFCIQQHVLKREELAAQNKLKRVIKSLLGTGTDPWSFDVIELETLDSHGVPLLETRPQHIHKILSEQATLMFADQTESIPCKINTALNNNYDEWATLLDNPTRLLQLLDTEAPDMPLETRHLIVNSILCKPERTGIKQELQTLFDKDFNFQHFQKLIHNRDSNSSPGISGLSIGMLKYIPQALLHTLFQLITLLWKAKRVPEHWKIKWLHCIPKKDDTISSITMLRPLGMLEVFRKIWVLMIIKPIKKVVLKHKALDNSQMAFLPNVGTDSELTVITHALAEAQKLKLGIDLLSWDIAKAFDSVHRKIQFLAWMRMGVPQTVAELLLDLDINGAFILKSPYAVDQMVDINSLPPLQRHRAQHQLGFPVGRGYTQGDVLSTLGWVFLFDIVITAVKNTCPDLHLRTRGIGSSLHTTGIVGFADDFITITIPELTPLFAITTSAAYAVLGLTSAVHKFRAVTNHNPTRSITVYNHSWIPAIVPFSDESHSIKVLGVLINLQLNWTPQYEDIKTKLKQAIRLLKNKRGHLTTKIKVLKMAVIPKLLYPAAKIGLTSTQLHELQRIPDELFTHKHIERSFPKFLLRSRYSPLQIPDLEKIILTHQVKTLLRVQNEQNGSPGNLAATGLIIEAIRTSMLDDPSITGCDIATPMRKSRYGTQASPEDVNHPTYSLMQCLHSHGIRTHLKGYTGAHDTVINIFSKVGATLNEDAREIIAAAEISYINELIELSIEYDPPCWIPASWISVVQHMFGYHDSNLQTCIQEYLFQFSHLSADGPPPCRLSQGQLLALSTPLGYLQFFDCAGINIETGRAEGSLHASNNPCSQITLTIPPASFLIPIEGTIRLGVTGNYTISITELQSRYLGRAIAVDYTRMNGVSKYRLLSIHRMNIDFDIRYLMQQPLHHYPRIHDPSNTAAACSYSKHTITLVDPTQLFNDPRPVSTVAIGSLLCTDQQDMGPNIHGLTTDLSKVPNISSLGAATFMEAIMLHRFPDPTTRISIGKGISARIKQRWHRRGNINLPYGMLCRLGKDGRNNHVHWTIPQTQIYKLDSPPLEELATKSICALEPESLATELHPKVECLALFDSIFHPGEFYFSFDQTPILGNPFSQLSLDSGHLTQYLSAREMIYHSKHKWTEDNLGLYPMISSLMLEYSFNKRKALCRQMYDHFYCNSVKVTRSLVPSSHENCSCCSQGVAETPEHVLYCSSHPRSIYRQYVLESTLKSSLSFGDAYTKAFVINILNLLFESEISNKRSLWMGRPTKEQLQRVAHSIDPRLRWPAPDVFTKAITEWYTTLIHHSLNLWRIRNMECHEEHHISSLGTSSEADSHIPTSQLSTINITTLLQRLERQPASPRTYRNAKIKTTSQTTLDRSYFVHNQNPSPVSTLTGNEGADLSNTSHAHPLGPTTEEFEGSTSPPLHQLEGNSELNGGKYDDTLVSGEVHTQHNVNFISCATPTQLTNYDPGATDPGSRHIECVSCLDYTSPGEGTDYTSLGPILNIPFEPTMTRLQLNSLEDGKSLHSSVMSCMFSIFNQHYNPPGRPSEYLFVYYVFLQQLVLGTRTLRSLTKQFFASSSHTNIESIKKAYLMVHLPSVPGGHWTYISLTIGSTTTIKYHDSLAPLQHHFQQFTQPLATFLTTLGLSSIAFEYANTPQQDDGCSCGAFALAGILAHANDTIFSHFAPRHVTCFRRDMYHSILTGTLLMHFTLSKRAQTQGEAPEDEVIKHPLLRTDRASPPTLKRTLSEEWQESTKFLRRTTPTQGLITDTFFPRRHDSSTYGYKRSSSFTNDTPPQKKAKNTAAELHFTIPGPHPKLHNNRKKTKKDRLRSGIFPKVID